MNWARRAVAVSAIAATAALALPARAAVPAVSRGAMAQAVTAALGLVPTPLGPRYVDVAASAPYARSVEAGADAGLWPAWRPGAAFRPAAPATVGQALAALVAGLGGARVAADLPDGLGRAAAALGLWRGGAPQLDAALTPNLLALLAARARVAPRGALLALDERCVRGVTWLWGGAPLASGATAWVQAVAIDRDGYALPVTLSVRASAGSDDNAEGLYQAPARPGAVTLTARAPGGVRSTLRLRIEGRLRPALLPAPGRLAAGPGTVLEAGVTTGRGPFAADSGRTITLTVAEGARRWTDRAPDDFGLAPFQVPALTPGPAVVTVAAAGLGSRVYRLRVAKAARPAGKGPSTAAPAPAPLAAGQDPFAHKGLWLPYWIYKATPLARILAEARRSGSRTIYLEVATSDDGVYGRTGLDRLLPAARRMGIGVVAWVYADLARPAADLRNLRAVAALRTSGGLRAAGLALDLEGSAPLPPWALAQELALARRLLGPAGALLAVTYPGGPLAPPYALIARYASAIAPMDYWHGRMQAMGYDRAYLQVAASIRAIRAAAPSTAVSVVAQAFDMFTSSSKGVYAPSAAELSGAIAAARAGGAEGVSFYQMGTASAAEWRVIGLAWPQGAS